MAENNNQSIYIIKLQSEYDSAGQEVTKDEYDDWANDNLVTAFGPDGNAVDIVGGNDKISVTDGTTTVGYDNVVQPSDGTGVTTYSTAITQAADDTITNDEALAFLQQNVDTALALRESIVTELDSLGRDPDKSVITIDGRRGFTLDAAEAGIDAAYAALYAYKDNLPALVTELQNLALDTIAEYQADVEGGAIVNLPELTPFDGQVTSTTVDTTGATVGRGLIVSLAETPTDTTLPTIDEGDTAIQTVEVTANTSVTKAIRDSLGLENQGPIIEKLISKAIDLGLNQIPGYSQINNAIGTADKIVRIGDIVTNVSTTPAETALALARLLIPQVNLVVTGFNLVTAGGGGGEDNVSLPGPDPVNPGVDPQVSAGGGGDDDFFGGLFGGVDADLIIDDEFTGIDAQIAANENDLQEPPLLTPEEVDAEIFNAGIDVDAEIERAAAEGIENFGPDAVNVEDIPEYYPNGLPYDDDGNLNPGWAINPETGEPYYIGENYVDPGTQALADAAREQATIAAATQRARNQQAIEVQRKQANEGDWRVRLRLAAGANYLYKDPGINSEGILWPLSITDGVIFPYTPKISSAYKANYSTSDLTHSNYRGYSYQNSYVDEISINAVFTAQDTTEANYLLAVIHFFRSVTKMFYGQDAQRGAPPPLVFLQGLGEFQYNLHPCVVSSFNYELPNDVDYIRARSTNQAGTSLLQRRDRQTLPTNSLWSSVVRLANATSTGLQPGALRYPPSVPSLGTDSPTYVPTKIEIQLSLLPIQSRQQISQQFSLKNFANGNLLKGGFW
jgi:hypothetical protein